MASSGPPTDPPEPPDGPRDRDVADWDWGDDWETPARSAGDGPETPARPVADGRDEDPGSRPERDEDPRDASSPEAEGDATDAAEAPARAPRGGPHPRTVLRRRALAVGGAAVAVVLVALGAVAVAGGSGGTNTAPPAADGGELRSLAGTAARSSTDVLERTAAVARYARIGRPIYCGAGRKPWVALTFDDGPGPLSPRFIALMAKEKVPMTLFRIGRNVPGNEEYVRVQRNLGWDAGSHTQNHPFLARLTAKEQRKEIEDGIAASRRVLGRPPELFRPPYESHDANTDKIVEGLGAVEILWNVDTQDSIGTTSSDQIVATATKGMKPGSIILMHEVKPNTLAAMPRVIAALRAKGLEPVTVTRMLAGDGPSEAQLRKGYDGCAVDLTPGKASS